MKAEWTRLIDRPIRFIPFSLFLLATGCMPHLRQPLQPQQARGFRNEALTVLKQAVTSDEPVLRMEALEAFQEVAPAEGLPYIIDNIDNGYAGVSFAALMAVGTIRDNHAIEKVRLRAEDNDASVKVAALFALHRLGDQKRTGEIGNMLLNNPDPHVRANAALVLGRLGENSSVRLLQAAIHQEKKDAVKMQIREALATLGDKRSIEELIFAGHSAVPDQATFALMFLANAKREEAEEVFRYRLHHADQPEIKLQAARGLGRLGMDSGYEIACAHLYFRSPDRRRKNDPVEQQLTRVHALAALALEDIGSADALGPLQEAFRLESQPPAARLAIARAAIGIITKNFGASASQTLR